MVAILKIQYDRLCYFFNSYICKIDHDNICLDVKI